MLADFKNLKRQINKLGGTYNADNQFLNFWDSVKTMKEKCFAQYVLNKKDLLHKLPQANRCTIDHYIRDMTSKQVAMEANNKWNKMSPEDTMVMALITMMDSDKPLTKPSAETRTY
jgi:hypothetical protein